MLSISLESSCPNICLLFIRVCLTNLIPHLHLKLPHHNLSITNLIVSKCSEWLILRLLMSRNSYKVSVVCCYVTCRSNLTTSRIGHVNEHTLPRVVKKCDFRYSVGFDKENSHQLHVICEFIFRLWNKNTCKDWYFGDHQSDPNKQCCSQ